MAQHSLISDKINQKAFNNRLSIMAGTENPNSLEDVFNKLYITSYTFTYQAQSRTEISDFPGSMLRGVFGETLLKLEQIGEVSDVNGYRLSAMLFDNRLNDSHPWHKEFSEPPRAYWFSPLSNYNTILESGDLLQFRFNLAGYYHELMPMLYPVFVEMGKTGFGRPRSPFHLLSVFMNGVHGNQIVLPNDSAIGENETIPNIKYLDFKKAVLLKNTIEIGFKTFTSNSQSHAIYGGIPFYQLLEALVNRTVLLSNLYCGSLFAEPGDWLDKSKDVRIIESHLKWGGYQRYSNRKQERAPIEGYIGSVTYCGQTALLEKYLPLLLMGQWLQAGRNIVFGGGRYEVDAACYKLN